MPPALRCRFRGCLSLTGRGAPLPLPRRPTCPADIVLLQEVWCGEDVAALRQAGAEGRLPHSAHFQGGALGPGLLLLSAFPVLETAFHPYSARGDPAALLQGDYLTGKGVGWAAVAAPCGRLSIFNVGAVGLAAPLCGGWALRVAAGLPERAVVHT